MNAEVKSGRPTIFTLTEMIDTAVILVGGKSTRYGRPKGLEPIRGKTLVSRIADEIRDAGIDNIYLAVNEPGSYNDLGIPLVLDRFPGCGPLAGIHSVLLETGAEKILVLPCDLPGISSSEIRKLLSAAMGSTKPVVFAVTGLREHPLCSVVSSVIVEEMETALKVGHYGCLSFFKSLDYGTVGFENESAFVNINTQEEMTAWGDCYGI
ncbi:MAG: molybdenum cofactor guanylyltransferase [bacterium]